MKILTLCFLWLVALPSLAQHTFVRFSTAKGDIVVMLYDGTPVHRDHFIRAVKDGTFSQALFNRVIKGFVSQAGRLDEEIEAAEKQHPEIPPVRIPAEINSQYFHKKGALGAGRNDNPEKSSFEDQIYLVQGKIQTDAMLDALEAKTGRKFPETQRAVYKTLGGIPRLDQDYTVFGEIVQGMDVAEAINAAATDLRDKPLEPVTLQLSLFDFTDQGKGLLVQ